MFGLDEAEGRGGVGGGCAYRPSLVDTEDMFSNRRCRTLRSIFWSFVEFDDVRENLYFAIRRARRSFLSRF